MDKKIKTIHDVFKLGSRAVINNQDYQLEEIMIWGTAEIIYTILRFIAKNGKNIVCSVDIETNEIMPLSSEQSTLYHENLNMHKERLVKTDSAGILNYKANSHRTENKVAIEKIIKQRNVKWVTSIVSLNDEDYKITWFSFLCNKEGDSLLVCVSEEEMQRGLSTQSLYCDVELSVDLPEYDLKYRGNIVRIEKCDAEYLLYIHPYPIEIMQSTQCKNTLFENICNPFSMMDFIVNHADSNVNGVVFPNSDEKHIHNYIVVGLLKNIEIDIEDCVIGNVRIGNGINVSEKFKQYLTDLSEECVTVAWVNIKSDSLYNAFSSGKKLLILATEFLSFMLKNDMYTDWFGTGQFDIMFGI